MVPSHMSPGPVSFTINRSFFLNDSCSSSSSSCSLLVKSALAKNEPKEESGNNVSSQHFCIRKTHCTQEKALQHARYCTIIQSLENDVCILSSPFKLMQFSSIAVCQHCSQHFCEAFQPLETCQDRIRQEEINGDSCTDDAEGVKHNISCDMEFKQEQNQLDSTPF